MKKDSKNKIVILIVVLVIAVIAVVAVVSGGKNAKTPTDATINDTVVDASNQEDAEESDSEQQETTEAEKILDTFDEKYVFDKVLSEDETKGIYNLYNESEYTLFVKNADGEHKLVLDAKEDIAIQSVSKDFSQFFFSTLHSLYKADFDGNVKLIADNLRATYDIDGCSLVTYDDMTAYYIGAGGLSFYDGTESYCVDNEATDFCGFPNSDIVIYNCYDEENAKATFYYARGTETGTLRYPEDLWYYDMVGTDENYLYYTTEGKNYRLRIDSEAYPKEVSEIPDEIEG